MVRQGRKGVPGESGHAGGRSPYSVLAAKILDWQSEARSMRRPAKRRATRLDDTIYQCGNCQLDTNNRRFIRDGKDVVLEPRVFAALVQLVSRPGKLVRREQWLDAVRGHCYVTASTLNRVIVLARRALLDDPAAPKFIQTIHGSGYRYVGPYDETRGAPAEAMARFAPPHRRCACRRESSRCWSANLNSRSRTPC
jgi:DNA-binding winged helix-turn-helix (wHTH) protein